MKLVVKNNNGDKFTLQIRPNETFLDLKRRVELESGISLDLRDITSNKRNINESQRVIDYFLNEQNQHVQLAQATDIVCAVPTCENKKSLNPDKTYFEFPQEDIRCHQWVLYCRRIAARLSVDSHKANLPINVGAPGTAICSDHFKWDQFVKNTTTLLKRTAVPCVNPELPPTTYPDPGRTFAITKGKAMPTVIAAPTSKVATQLNIPKPSTTGLMLSSQSTSFNLSTTKLACRLCALPSRNTVYIYSCEGKSLMLAEKISASLPINVKMTDHLPKQVCRSCIDKLNSTFYLVEISCAADDVFKAKMADKTSSKDHPEDTQTPGSQCPCCREGQLQIVPSHRFAYEDDCSTDNVQTALPSLFFDNEEAHHQQPEVTHDSINPCQEEDILADYLNIGSALNDDQEVYTCRICATSVRTHARATDHALSHGSDGVFQCTICENYYGNPQELVDHFQSHASNNSSQLFCEKCGIEFLTVLEVSEHRCNDELMKFDDSAQKKCVLCSRTFSSEHRFQFHMNYHTSSSKGECSVCGQTFPTEGKLYRHMLEHEGVSEVSQIPSMNATNVHEGNEGEGDTAGSGGDNDADPKKWCDDCGISFKSDSAYNFHIKCHANPDLDLQKPYGCEWCGKKFVRRSTLRNHVAAAHRHTQESSCFTCKVCREAFPTTGHAVLHMDSYHNNYVENEPSYSFEMITVTRLFMCEYCEKVFAESSVLHKHRESAHSSSSATGIFFICKYCNNSFTSHSSLQEHKLEHSKQEIPPEYQGEMGVPTTYLCEYCERVFVNYVKYTEHLTIHFGAEPYVCRICGTKYSTLDEVTEHRTVHGDLEPMDDIDLNRPYDCHYCDKTFAIEDALTKHIRMHTGEKPFTCDVCGKGFSQSSGLNTHKKVHSNVRPFACHLCPRTFKIKGDRDVHIRKHSGQRPFKCEFCFKAFMTQHVYSQHRKIHTGERPYRCDVCHVAFRRSHVLTVHKRIHTGEKPNVCDVCGKRYRQKGDMLKHRRSQHGVGRDVTSHSVVNTILSETQPMEGNLTAQELAGMSPQFFSTLKPSLCNDDLVDSH